MAVAVALALAAIFVLLLLVLAYLVGRDKSEPLGDDLTVRNLRPRGNVRRIEDGDDE